MPDAPSPLQLAQLARLLEAGDLPGPSVGGGRARPKGIDLDRLRALVDERLERLARGLLEEAAANDDVVDAASAQTYLEDRLAYFGELLSEEQRRRLREACRKVMKGWG